MYLTIKPFLVLAAMAGAFTYFLLKAKILLDTMLALPKKVSRTENLPARLQAVMMDVFLQRKVREKKAAGYAHTLIFWGFIIITVGTVEMMIEGIFHGINLHWLSPTLNRYYQGLADIMMLAVLCGVAFGFFRRLVLKPKYLVTGKDALFVLTITASLMLSLFFMNAFKIASAPESYAGLYPLSSILYEKLNFMNMDPSKAFVGVEVFYWAHLLLVLGFSMYIPNSKHLHILAAGPNIFFKHLGKSKALETTNLEDENATSFGLGKASDLSWKNALDLYACTECGRCQEACPADLTGKPLSPSRLVHDFKVELFAQREHPRAAR